MFEKEWIVIAEWQRAGKWTRVREFEVVWNLNFYKCLLFVSIIRIGLIQTKHDAEKLWLYFEAKIILTLNRKTIFALFQLSSLKKMLRYWWKAQDMKKYSL